jgi:hypothetical protein
MSMHLVGPYLTTTKYSSKKKSASKSKRLAESTAKHEQWLRDRGLHPEQRNLQRAFKGKHQNELPDYTNTCHTAKLSNGVGNGYKKGIMANLHKETPEVQQAILDKASRCLPLYNKGGYQYATPGTDMTMVGSKTRRG